MVHDPLGLELVLSGKIRGQPVRHEDYEQLPLPGLDGFGVSRILDGVSGDQNTLKIGVVFLSPPPR